MAIKVEEYLTGEGKNHYKEWFDKLAVEYASKVAAARARRWPGEREAH